MSSDLDQRDIFLKGKHVILKVLNRQDCIESGWYGWFNDEELCATLQKHYFPTALDAQIVFWEESILNAQDKIQLGICSLDGGPIVGIASLSHIDLINRKAEFSIVIGERASKNIIMFHEAAKLLFTHGFNSLNLNRIYGGSISRDLVLLICRLLNCKEEGVLRQEVFKNGAYRDVYRYAVLRDEFIPQT